MAGVGWEGAVLVENQVEGYSVNPNIAMDAAGNAIAVWQQWDDMAHLWSSRYVPGVGWGSEERIDAGISGHHTYPPQIVMDGAGNLMVAWEEYHGISDIGDSTGVWSNRYTAGIGWGIAEMHGAGTLYQIAVDGAGNALVVWCEHVFLHEDELTAIRSRWYLAGVGWKDAEVIGVHPDYNPYGAKIAVDTAGNAFAVWIFSETLSPDRIWFNRYVAGVGWNGGQQVSAAGEVSNLQIVTDGKGGALLVWEQLDGTNISIWSSRFD